MPNEQPTFARFFRAVEGKLAPRHGTASRTAPNLLIGARRLESGNYEWDTKTIHPITEAEASKYAREYDRLVREKALVEVTAAEYQQQREAHLEAKREAKKAKEAAEKAQADKDAEEASAQAAAVTQPEPIAEPAADVVQQEGA